MNAAIKILVLVCIIVLDSKSQSWLPQKSGTQAILNFVFFVDLNNGWAVGSDSTILHTTNGGTDWTTQKSGLTELNSVYFLNKDTGWAVGYGILKTTNGGQKWTIKDSSISSRYVSIRFIGRDTGWIAGANNLCRQTIDGGENWNDFSCGGSFSGSDRSVADLYFTTNKTGWITTNETNPAQPTQIRGVIWKTTNGAGSWTKQKTADWLTPSVYYGAIHFINDSVGGFATASYGEVNTTINGGQTWNSTPLLFSGFYMYVGSLYFQGAESIYAVGSHKNGKNIAKSIDGGSHWTQETTGSSQTLNNVFFIDSNTGWAVGQNGTILKYSIPPTSILKKIQTRSDQYLFTVHNGIIHNKPTERSNSVLFFDFRGHLCATQPSQF